MRRPTLRVLLAALVFTAGAAVPSGCADPSAAPDRPVPLGKGERLPVSDSGSGAAEVAPLASAVLTLDPLPRAAVVDFEPAARPAPPAPEYVVSVSGRRFYPTGQAHLDTALAYVGVVERGGNNRGPEIERFLRSVGIGPGAPWCAAFTSYCRRVAADAGSPTGPFERPGVPHYGAVATRHLSFGGKVSAAEVWRGAQSVPPGSHVVWRNGNSWTGHVGFVWKDDDPQSEGFAAGDRSPDALSWRHRCGYTVEGNTSSGDAGSQRDGGGVYTRLRCLSYSHFKIDGFVAP